MNHFIEFFGRLHPLIVHLPIGFLLLGLLLQWYNKKQQYQLEKAIAIAFLWGGILAMFACITGYILYTKEGFAYDTVKPHLWFGIITAVFAFVCYIRISKAALKKIPATIFSLAILVLISLTGHFGGNITHGTDYLTEPLPASVKKFIGADATSGEEIVLNEENYKDVVVYTDIIQPILNNKCVSCHGDKKTKGKLALHTPEAIEKGGKNGMVLDLEQPDSSALYHRLILPEDSKKHMPPKDKTQLTKEEVALIGAWVRSGASFNKTVATLQLPKELFSSFWQQEKSNELPEVAVKPVPEKTLDELKDKGFNVKPLGDSSNFIEVSCINYDSFSDADFSLLKDVQEQIAYLDLRHTRITDAIFKNIAKLPNLVWLKLDHTSVTGKNMEELKNLSSLLSISLTYTKFSKEYLRNLKGFPALEQVYLFQSEYQLQDGVTGMQKHDDYIIDYGQYQLPKLATDTIVY